MKKTVSALLMAGLLPLSVADTLAYQTGTINFTGNVAEGTCTVEDLNNTVSLKNLTVEHVNNAVHGEAMISDQVSSYFNVSNCPASITKANIRFDYISEGNPRYLKLDSGSSPGIALWIKAPGVVSKPGEIKTFPLVNGKFSGLLTAVATRNTSDPDMGVPAQTVTEGTFSAVANLTMSFE